MSMPNPYRYLARVTIELTTPLLIGGDQGDLTDRIFVADANGLPTIPGTSLCGVLRHALKPELGEDQVKAMFGHQDGDDGHGSRLAISFGHLHDRTNCPVDTLLEPAALRKDPVLAQAREGIFRDHVRIGHHGAVDDSGKFDQTAVAAGHRFTFELELTGSAEDRGAWTRLLTLLTSGALRLGGSTRRGFGGFKVVAASQQVFDLACEEGFSAYCQHPIRLSEAARLADPLPASAAPRQLQIDISLQPEGFWMFGGGDFDQKPSQRAADMLPVSESRICWPQDRGEVGPEEVLIPASSVKGALAHRFAFYARALAGEFADGLDPEAIDALGKTKPAAQVELFGDAKDDQEGQTGSAGRLFLDDLYLAPATLTQKHVDHVSIDRFTGGPIDGALFSEKPFFGGPPIPLKICIANPDQLSADARRALQLTLADLSRGELSLGAGVNRGNGVLVATSVSFSDPDWIEGGAA